jgi:hypothetical protein
VIKGLNWQIGEEEVLTSLFFAFCGLDNTGCLWKNLWIAGEEARAGPADC